MRSLATVAAALGFALFSFATLQLLVGLFDQGGNVKLWLIAAVIGAAVAAIGAAFARTETSR